MQIATRMVIQYGWGPDDSPTIYHHGNAVLIYKYNDIAHPDACFAYIILSDSYKAMNS